MNESAAAGPRRSIFLLAVALAALVADFATKEIALARFSPHDPVELLNGLLKLTLVFNPGAAFSIGTGVTWVFSLVMIAVIAYILAAARKVRSAWWAVTLGLILGGAAGNLVDRVWRPDSPRDVSASLVGSGAQGSWLERLFSPPAPLHGHVVDWIQIPNWPVFNIADSCIVCGGVLAVLLAFRGVNIDGTRESDRDREDTGEASSGGDAGDGPRAAEPRRDDPADQERADGAQPPEAPPAAPPASKEDGRE
ncbi:signal peptidase II [Spinactinospora alkalitolerans]|uniref:Lipoprotein signal peptidase n=1 Tax=Spinactinospora alkalitolerans TaxID=687207 RepID=A0A852TZ38_9ACTN|nr:signal peptidase II [Spinactinospora alkalitolerans]NYE48605.1 signal peptidase II [Spinactinospora alkalitolerans]